MPTTRRDFLKISAAGSTGLLLSPATTLAAGQQKTGNELIDLSDHLVRQWGDALLALQVNKPGVKGLHGGILCPACATVHGRCGDAIYPLLYLADKTKDKKYIDAALRLYDWMETMVSTPDGAWLNEVSVSDWKGITVFGATALAETLIHFEHVLDTTTRTNWKNRLQKAGDYLYNNFTIDTGNINYPMAGSYALCLIGTYLQKPDFIAKGKSLAQQCLAWFTTPNALLFGEGKPIPEKSAKGCYSVDLGYNVEESLPSLVLYGKLMNDKKVLDVATKSMEAHLEFMLPDGAWDNSWGTRNFKWTYWGSRTSDGCQPAYGLMADEVPAFYRAALQNTRLLTQCTHNNLLHGGPHYVQHGILPCVGHSLAHSKALTTMLLKLPAIRPATAVQLPRETNYGVKTFPEIYTWLITKNKWRATITGYDQEYSMKGGHATGGALSLLWHDAVGTLLVASMSRYQLTESFNMQRDKVPSICFTPGFSVEVNKQVYRNIQDLKATIDHTQTAAGIQFNTHSALVDENQAPAPIADCEMIYRFTDDAVIIQASTKNEQAVFSLPVISTSHEKVNQLSADKLEIHKAKGIIVIEANAPIKMVGALTDRVFNFVPGMEALPLQFETNTVEIKISVR